MRAHIEMYPDIHSTPDNYLVLIEPQLHTLLAFSFEVTSTVHISISKCQNSQRKQHKQLVRLSGLQLNS